MQRRIKPDEGGAGIGASGYSGYSGFSSYSGISGYSGAEFVGSSGYSGIAGVSGYSGALSTGIYNAINAQTGTSYQLVLTDAGNIVTLTNSGAISVTVPTNSGVSFLAGTRIDLIQGGVGKVTFSGVGVIINSKAGNLSIGAQNVAVSLVKIATDIWYLTGDLIA